MPYNFFSERSIPCRVRTYAVIFFFLSVFNGVWFSVSDRIDTLTYVFDRCCHFVHGCKGDRGIRRDWPIFKGSVGELDDIITKIKSLVCPTFFFDNNILTKRIIEYSPACPLLKHGCIVTVVPLSRFEARRQTMIKWHYETPCVRERSISNIVSRISIYHGEST